MNIPIDVVVELLMENASPAKCGGGQIMLGGELYDSLREDDLRGYIHTYLQSLVPAPKLLSECEEPSSRFLAGWRDVVTGKEGRLSHIFDTVEECNEFCEKANNHLQQTEYFSVAIQPVEVNRE